MNIAIFGGSFDPPHIGHENIVNLITSKLDIDKLFITPTYLSPFKDEYYLSPKIRLELISLLFEDNKKIEVCSYEVKQENKVPTIKTINYLKSIYSIEKIYLIIGADNLKNIHLWYNFDKLKDLVDFVVISRDNHILKNKFINTINYKLDTDVSSSQLRKKMELKYIPTKIQEKVKKLWKID